jgi:hypothetical protein
MSENSKTTAAVPTTPAWCQVGSTVAIVNASAASRSTRSVKMATVLRIGKRDIVLDNDMRFRVDGLDRRVGGTWGHVEKLADPTSEAVLELRAEIEHDRLVWKAKVKAEDFRYDRNGVTAEDVIRALAPLVDDPLCGDLLAVLGGAGE